MPRKRALKALIGFGQPWVRTETLHMEMELGGIGKLMGLGFELLVLARKGVAVKIFWALIVVFLGKTAPKSFLEVSH